MWEQEDSVDDSNTQALSTSTFLQAFLRLSMTAYTFCQVTS